MMTHTKALEGGGSTSMSSAHGEYPMVSGGSKTSADVGLLHAMTAPPMARRRWCVLLL